jgi:hypothetical protein
MKTVGNAVFPKAGLNGFDWTFVQGFNIRSSIGHCAKNPRLR